MIARAFFSKLQTLSTEFPRVYFLLLAAALAQPAGAATYYVATTGNDANSGTSTASPFRNIQKAMNVVLPGDTVLIRGGTYREQVEAIKGGTASKPITVSAYPGEIPIIKGSDVVTGWVQNSTTVWKKTGWAINSQQVFVDFDTKPAKSLLQMGMPSQYYTTWEYPSPVGTGLSDIKLGSFFYDAAAATLYVRLADGSNPNNRKIEVSVRRRLFTMHQPWINVKGLRFRHSNMSAHAQQGAAVELSSNSSIEDCDIQYMDFAGLGMGYLQDSSHVHNCIISNNGNSGINSAGATNFWISSVTLQYNNSRNFNTLWHAGGFKGAANTYGVIENSVISNNNGSGIWFDYSKSAWEIIIRNNYVHDNGPSEAAIFFEVSNNGLIYNNVISKNWRRGVYLSAANNTRVYNNTIYGTSSRAGVEIAGMPRDTATLTNNVVFNNIISHGSSTYDLYIMPANGTTITGNSSDYNNFYRSNGTFNLRYVNVYQTFSGWRGATGMDMHSISANPAYVAPGTSASGYAVAAGSPVIDAGTNLIASVNDDYLKLTRPSGTAVDIGAFEYNQSVVAPPAAPDTVPPVVTIDSTVATTATSLTISASATDNIGVTGMQLLIGGVLKASSTNGQVSYAWNSPAPGSYELQITASDAANNTGSATGTLTIK